MLKVSIITVCFNSEKTIQQTLDSVASQSYPNIEHIIIDGLSSDLTISIVSNHYNNNKIRFLSEPDDGLYDAMNKGIQLATGDIIGILNSDDLYPNSGIISLVVDRFQKTECDMIYGDLEYFNGDYREKTIRIWNSGQFFLGKFHLGWHPPHPTCFIYKKDYIQYGMYNNSLKISADFDLMYRYFEVHKLMSSYIPQVLVRMRLGGESNKSLKNIVIGNLNVIRVLKSYNPRLIVPIYILRRVIFKVRTYFKKR